MLQTGAATRPAPITVIIPAFNAAAFIAEAVAQVRAQTLPVAELLVVDDGSTDRTAELAAAAGARVICQANAGPSAARNAGLRAATQPWVAFLDADDLWRADKLERQWAALALCPEARAVACDYDVVDAAGRTVRGASFRAACGAAQRDGAAARQVGGEAQQVSAEARRVGADGVYFSRVTMHFFECFFPLPSTLMLRRDLIVARGAFDETLRLVADFECYLRLLAGGDLIVVALPLVSYRRHDGNCSRDQLLMYRAMRDLRARVAARPTLYPAEAGATIEHWLTASALEVGRWLMDEARLAEARRCFAQAVRSGGGRRAALLWLFSFGPAALFRRAVRLKRAFVRRCLLTDELGFGPLGDTPKLFAREGN
ncbi:MAG TPA: glycosyltransferase [Pyrinomonadaceae bacterium]|jgi:glycosyltransferase involved in cell wall biosynthesis